MDFECKADLLSKLALGGVALKFLEIVEHPLDLAVILLQERNRRFRRGTSAARAALGSALGLGLGIGRHVQSPAGGKVSCRTATPGDGSEPNSFPPGHDRDRRDRVLWRAFD